MNCFDNYLLWLEGHVKYSGWKGLLLIHFFLGTLAGRVLWLEGYSGWKGMLDVFFLAGRAWLEGLVRYIIS